MPGCCAIRRFLYTLQVIASNTAEGHFDEFSDGSVVIAVAEVVSRFRRRGVLQVIEIKQRRRVTMYIFTNVFFVYY